MNMDDNNIEKKCPVCQNIIDSHNKFIVCKECGARFCSTCEGKYRKKQNQFLSNLCESCFNLEQMKLELCAIFGVTLDGFHPTSRQERLERETNKKIESEWLMKQQEKNEKLMKDDELRNKKFTNSIGMEFVKIPAGEFEMGSPDNESGRFNDEGPVHKVTISTAFYLGKYPVTQKQWKVVMGNNPSYFEGDDRPVECVSWYDVQEFINRLNEKEGIDKYHLPSEAEWEYACRAGTNTRYFFGDHDSKLCEYIYSYDDFSEDEVHLNQKKPNPWGLYGMYGYVNEWVQDKWHDNYNGAPDDGSPWEDGNSLYRVGRGGPEDSHILLDGYHRSAYRYRGIPEDADDFYHGFRLMRKL